MAQVEFIFNGYTTKIQCDINENFISICNKYASKAQTQINNLYFLYNGNYLNQQLTFSQVANDFDKERKMMSLIVIEKVSTIISDHLIIPKEIVCPLCLDNIRMKIDDYKITFYECKNGHYINKILLKEYENMQKIDEFKIICEKCQNNKAKSFQKQFYKCNSCKINLCLLCKTNHNNNHNIVDYEKKLFL